MQCSKLHESHVFLAWLTTKAMHLSDSHGYQQLPPPVCQQRQNMGLFKALIEPPQKFSTPPQGPGSTSPNAPLAFNPGDRLERCHAPCPRGARPSGATGSLLSGTEPGAFG